MVIVSHGWQNRYVAAKFKVRGWRSVYIGIFLFSVSAGVFPGVSILYVGKTKEVEEVCWGFPHLCKPWW